MRTASMVLGIIGGAIAILFSVVLILSGATFMNSSIWGNAYDSSEGLNDIVSKSDYIEQTASSGVIFLVTGICLAAAGILGLVGGIIVKRKHVAAGVMMIIAAVLSIFGFFNLVCIILFILGSVFALRREPQYAIPPGYYLYPQQPAPPVENPPEQPTP